VKSNVFIVQLYLQKKNYFNNMLMYGGKFGHSDSSKFMFSSPMVISDSYFNNKVMYIHTFSHNDSRK
jgi:hypothetical protein